MKQGDLDNSLTITFTVWNLETTQTMGAILFFKIFQNFWISSGKF